MSRASEASSNHVVSVPVLVAVAITGIGLAFWMMPSEDELLTNLERDRLGKEVIPLLRGNWMDHARSANAALATISRGRMAEVSRLAHLTPHERLRSLCDPRKLAEFDSFSEALAVSSFRYVDVMKPREADAILSPVIARLPPKHTKGLLTTLADNALACNDAALAAKAMLHLCDHRDATWDQVQRMMTVCGWAGKPGDAATTCEQWIKRHESDLTPKQLDIARHAMEQLAIVANMPGKAFDLAVSELHELPAITDANTELLERCRQAAVFAGRSKEMLPWIDLYLQSSPLAKLSWQDLIKLPKPLADNHIAYVKWLRHAAQIADWNSLARESYHYHQRLVSLGDTDRMDRVLELTAHLGYGLVTAELLKALGPIEGREQLKLDLARLIAANGDADDARRLFEEWAKEHPEDRDARYELANLVRGIADTTSALRAFEAFVHDFPDDGTAIKRLAELRLRAGQPGAALDAFDSLRDEDLDAITLEDYISLAETVERTPSLLRALKLMAETDGADQAEIYERMYELCRSINNEDEALKLLRDGIARSPDRPSLRLKLANHLLEREQASDAITETLNPVLVKRTDALSIALAALRLDPSRTHEVLQAFGGDIEKQSVLSSSDRIHLAVACARDNQIERSRALFASVPQTREHLATLAEGYLDLQQFDEAERLAERNVRENTPTQARDWLLLGDARSKAGHADEAREAYARALTDMRDRVRSRDRKPPVIQQTGL